MKLKFLYLALDLFLAILLLPSGYIAYAFRRVGSSRLPISTKLLRSIGVFPIINNYYEPLFRTNRLFDLGNVRVLPGVELNTEFQLNFLKELIYSNELVELELNKNPKNTFDFKLKNGSFESGDAEFLYQFLRFIKPHKVIEIGSGNSTKIAAMALKRNLIESFLECQHICIEPYEMDWLMRMDGISLIREKVENLDIDWQETLEAGDLLFIDSSHIIRPQGDVLKEFLEILPKLKSGVYIHIHDIFTPRDYLKKWLVDDIKFWNEQYIVEALLSNTNRYEIISALNYLKNDHYDALKKVCPYLEVNREPGSLYLKVI
jgi:hypothetical protein